MELTFLGTGTSTGVPQLRCGCEVCTSSDDHDKRLRCSALLEADGKRVLIDCGPDFRQQMLVNGKRSYDDRLDALIITHQHYDHVGGLDDLRPYGYRILTEADAKDYQRLPRQQYDFPVYCQKDVADDLRQRMPYSFNENPYPGAPRFELIEISPYLPFNIGKIGILPLRVNHYLLEILGFRIGPLGYITDAKVVPEKTIVALEGVDTLVINALRQEPHISHLSLEEALAIIARIKPRVAYLTHISHDMGLHSDIESTLPPNVHLAYDNLKISIN